MDVQPRLSARVRLPQADTNKRERSSDIRAWAMDQGITVSERGRMPARDGGGQPVTQVLRPWYARRPSAWWSVPLRAVAQPSAGLGGLATGGGDGWEIR